MKPSLYGMQDETWIRDQTARILNRYTLAGKHWRLELDSLLSRAAQLRNEIPAENYPVVLERKAA